MIHKKLEQQNRYYGTSYNSSNKRVLLTLGDNDDRTQIRVSLTKEETLKLIKELEDNIKKIDTADIV